MIYFRPIAMTDAARPADARPLAGGWCWFTHAERIERGGARSLVAADDIPANILARLTAPRAPLALLTLDQPRLMAILNTTPDSFSDGGRFSAPDAAQSRARFLIAAGADLLDIGGESTRPGASTVAAPDEIARTAPLIAELRAAGAAIPISVDTRKAAVADAALLAGADMVNDVSALRHDPAMAELLAAAGVPVCLMHAQGSPADMQIDPHYADVVLDVHDFLADRIAVAEAAGIDRSRILIDPGIGFGKTLAHNLALLRNLSLFHGLGCGLILGASRKRFIGTLGNASSPDQRMPGSIAVALAALAQGVQVLRIHDMAETRQALTLWRAVTGIERANP